MEDSRKKRCYFKTFLKSNANVIQLSVENTDIAKERISIMLTGSKHNGIK